MSYPLDKALKVWEHADLRCAVVDSDLGFINGYVQVPDAHIAFGKSYGRLPVNVHGGLTYDNNDGWFGFDTGHGGDYWSPEALKEAGASTSNRIQLGRRDSSWTLDKLVAEVNDLADQLADLTDLGRADTWSITSDELTELYDERDQLRSRLDELEFRAAWS